MRPTRGTHLVYPALTRGHGVLLFARSDGRVFFVVPFGAHSLVGTTEVEVSSPPSAEATLPELDEVAYLRRELARALPRPANQPALAVMSGLRPILGAPGEVTAASREHRVLEEGPVLTVAGGKYTTFRVMARDVLERAKHRVGRGALPIRDSREPLPRPFAASHDIEAMTAFAAQSEFARRIEDVVRRRSTLWLTPDRGRVAAPTVAAVLARTWGWDERRTRDEMDLFHAALEREERLLNQERR
jgi:glycerol-3-phosphate dehydrogenase